MFYVTSWDTGERLSEHETLPIARRYARGEGHTGAVAPNGNYPPIAYVANEKGECVYNPRFRSKVNLGGLTIGPDDCLRG